MFKDKLRAAIQANNSFLCIGLDPDPDLMPHPHVTSFLQEIVDATSDIACAYKPNLAFFEALGPEGMQILLESVRSVPRHIPIIADAKRCDIGNTSRMYARALFDIYKFDAVTVNPYGGREGVQPFIDYTDRGVFVWCRSSGPGAADIQDLTLSSGTPLYEAVAAQANQWNTHGNVGLVVGATWPEQIERVRDICPGMLLLLPGVGSQAGDLEASVQAAIDECGGGFLVNASRSILYASRAREAAITLRNRIRDAVAGGTGHCR